MTFIGLLTTMIWRYGHKSDNNKRWVKGGGIDHSTVQSEEMWTGVSQLDSVKSRQFGAILPIYIHNSLSLSLSVQYTEQNQAILLHELHRMHVLSSRFYKVLQISLRPNICYIF